MSTRNEHNGMVEARLCSYLEYPNHPHQSKRRPCQLPLFKETTAVQLQAIKPISLYSTFGFEARISERM